MLIISHRGLWRNSEEKNTRDAFALSFNRGMGIETDLRDHCGQIVIAHDMPHGSEMPFEELLVEMNGRNLPLALNIKADGIGVEIRDILQKHGHTNYFAFDMSIPEMVRYAEEGIPYFTGMSDLQTSPVLFDKAHGVWLDSFFSDWFDADSIDRLLCSPKTVCVVSSELHGRKPFEQWTKLKKVQGLAGNSLLLCTDIPLECAEYFGVAL